jgi:hypothetical protein
MQGPARVCGFRLKGGEGRRATRASFAVALIGEVLERHHKVEYRGGSMCAPQTSIQVTMLEEI